MKLSFLKKGSLPLLSAELFERFSYYSLKIVLLYYIYHAVSKGALGKTEEDAIFIIAILGTTAYFLSILGGWLADRVIGSYKCVIYGLAIKSIGAAFLAIPKNSFLIMIVAGFIIAAGTGLVMSNFSSLLGSLYSGDIKTKQIAFNILFIAINIGSLFAPFVMDAILDNSVGKYHIAFLWACLSCVISFALLRFCFNKEALKKIDIIPNPITKKESKKSACYLTIITIAIGVTILLLKVFKLLTINAIGIMLPVGCALMLIIMFYTIIKDRELTKTNKDMVLAFLPVLLINTFTMAAFELETTVFLVLGEEDARNVLFRHHFSAGSYMIINPLICFIGAPLLAFIWQKSKKPANTLRKIIFGVFLVNLSFIIPIIAFEFIIKQGSRFNTLVLIVPIIILTIAELYIYPTGLTATASLAPKKYTNRIMAMFFLGTASGVALNSFTIRFFSAKHPSGFFSIYVVLFSVVLLLALIGYKSIKKLAHNALD